MTSNQKIASRLQNNLRFTSDNINMADCYWLCANKDQIQALRSQSHQMIWGRRGTGKTTLLKAFNYEINHIESNPSVVSLYIMLAGLIPDKREINIEESNSVGITLYVFCTLIAEICEQLGKIYEHRSNALEPYQSESFIGAYDELIRYLTTAETVILGAKISMEQTNKQESTKETSREAVLSAGLTNSVFKSVFSFLKKHNGVKSQTNLFQVQGTLGFNLETKKIESLLTRMLDLLGISFAYICLDEFSEVDKLFDYSIQSSLAQMIKQVFFKNEKYSVKIASIWNESKLQSRGGNRLVEGIEYKQDIFPGPDLDTVFLNNHEMIKPYFIGLLVNTYYGSETPTDKEAIAACLENNIFGKDGLRHLICGSQGISRDFALLCKDYLSFYTAAKTNMPLRLGVIYDLIKNQYLEKVHTQIPKYDIYKVINKFMETTQSRYFLISRDDYQRCNSAIKYLEARGVYMQLPGVNTARALRDDYKLFIINYGNYLDALENRISYQKGRKTLDEDSNLNSGGSLFPDQYDEIVSDPQKYVIKIPENVENQVYCEACRGLYYIKSEGRTFICPKCEKMRYKFSDYREK